MFWLSDESLFLPHQELLRLGSSPPFFFLIIFSLQKYLARISEETNKTVNDIVQQP